MIKEHLCQTALAISTSNIFHLSRDPCFQYFNAILLSIVQLLLFYSVQQIPAGRKVSRFNAEVTEAIAYFDSIIAELDAERHRKIIVRDHPHADVDFDGKYKSDGSQRGFEALHINVWLLLCSC